MLDDPHAEPNDLVRRIAGFLDAGTAARNPQRATSLLREVVDNPLMPMTSKEKQEAFRARNAMLGMTEVRGIFLPPDKHAELKEYAKKLAAKKPKPLSPA